MHKHNAEGFSAAENSSVHEMHVIYWPYSAKNPGVRLRRTFRHVPKSRACGTVSPGLRQQNCRTPGLLARTGLRRYTAQRRPKAAHGQRGYVVILDLVVEKILVSFGAKLNLTLDF